MALDVESTKTTALTPELDAAIRERVDSYLAEQRAKEKKRQKRMAIISTKGTLDWAYPPLILASSAAAMGWDVGIFFTFYGLNIIHKQKGAKLKVAPLANPAAPMPMGLPGGMPNLVGAIPGMTSMGTVVMKKMFKGKGVAGVDELLQSCVDLGVRLMPCQMTVDVFGYKQDDFIPAAEPACGAAAFIRYASEADISLFI
jgi:peroxiredoxin family protein